MCRREAPVSWMSASQLSRHRRMSHVAQCTSAGLSSHTSHDMVGERVGGRAGGEGLCEWGPGLLVHRPTAHATLHRGEVESRRAQSKRMTKNAKV